MAERAKLRSNGSLLGGAACAAGSRANPSEPMSATLPDPHPLPGSANAAFLTQITAGLSAGGDLRALLQRLLEPLVRLAGAQGGAVRVLTDRGDQLRLVSSIGPTPQRCSGERQVDRHCGFCGAAADGLRVVWAADASPCHEPAGAAARPMLTVPLQHRARVLGVYNLFYARGDEPAPDVLALLKSVGELLGLALDNARLEAEAFRATLAHERQMMAAEVHDSLAQSLAFVKMRMPLLQDAMRARDDARAQRYFDDVRGAVTQAHANLRGILTDLRAPMDPLGLGHALDASVESFRRSSATELDFVNELPGLQLDPGQEIQVFHIVQEALTNIVRHAAARHARLHIAPAPRGDVQIVIEDDGAGLPAAAGAGAHYGLEIMLERARHIGGSLEVGARSGGGTRVQLAFPLQAGAPPAQAARTGGAF